jgi:DNA-binding NtrC family response regulator
VNSVTITTSGETISSATSTPKATTERVLIVEDDSAARVGLEQLVKSWGFVAESATDGEDGLAKVTSFRPAIVISDLVMPRMDGLSLLRALQQQGADVTTLLLTAQGTVETAVEAMKGGRLRLPHQADRYSAAENPARQDRRAARDDARGESAAPQLRESGTFGSLIGNAPEMRKTYQIVEQARRPARRC